MASNGNTPTLPDEVNKPPEGVVLPPKDIRGSSPKGFCWRYMLTFHVAIVEKTAGYVARNGFVFEGALSVYVDSSIFMFHFKLTVLFQNVCAKKRKTTRNSPF